MMIFHFMTSVIISLISKYRVLNQQNVRIQRRRTVQKQKNKMELMKRRKMFGVTFVLLHFKSNCCRVRPKRYVLRSNGSRTNNIEKKKPSRVGKNLLKNIFKTLSESNDDRTTILTGRIIKYTFYRTRDKFNLKTHINFP